jgi:hypothetical protein
MRWRNWTRNLSAKILSFFFAVALWLSVTNEIDFEEEIIFPIEYVNRPEGLTSIQPLPESVRAQVRGKGRFLRYSLRDAVCRVDLSGNQAGLNTIGVGGANIVLPSDARVARVDVLEPKRILAEFDETVIRDIPITPTVVGIPAAKHVQVGKTFVNPSAARVKGPRRLVDQIALVPTDEISIQGNRNTVRKKVKLLKSFGPTVEITPEMVEIGITIEPILIETLQNVAVEITDDLPNEWTHEIRPESLVVKVSGARSFVETASKQPSTLGLSLQGWSLGSTPIRLREIRGRRLIFSSGTQASAGAGSERGSGGEIQGMISLPYDVEILEVQPKELVIAIQRSRSG